MITNIFINFIVLILGSIFSWLPQVTALPSIAGFDLDTALATGIGQMNTFFVSFWPLKYMFDGFLVLMTYYGLKMAIRFVLGHRSPAK